MTNLHFGCVCITHNRPNVLPEVIESFLRQTYTDAELVILDDADQYPSQEGDRWKLVSMKNQFASNGVKRDYLIRNLFSDKVNAIANFDDDDIAFSNYLAALAENFEPGVDVVSPSGHCQLLGKGEYVYDMPLVENLRLGWIAHRGGWLRDAYLSSGGYPAHAHHADDQELMASFVRAGKNIRLASGHSPVMFYLTRIYSEYGHLSWNQYGDAEVKRVEEPIIPYWKEEYESQCRDTLHKEARLLENVHIEPETVGHGYPQLGPYLGYDDLMVDPPAGLKDCCFLTMHAPSSATIENKAPLKLAGFLNGTAARSNMPPIRFHLDDNLLGEVWNAWDQTNEISVPAGKHRLTITTDGDPASAHTLWAFR